jgi:hypothetical protein
MLERTITSGRPGSWKALIAELRAEVLQLGRSQRLAGKTQHAMLAQSTHDAGERVRVERLRKIEAFDGRAERSAAGNDAHRPAL